MSRLWTPKGRDLDMKVVDTEDKIPAADLTNKEDKIVVEHKDVSQKIKDIVQKDKVVRDRVQKLLRSSMDSVKNIRILQRKMVVDTVIVSVYIVEWILMITLLLKRWLSVKKQQSKQPQNEQSKQMNILRGEEAV